MTNFPHIEDEYKPVHVAATYCADQPQGVGPASLGTGGIEGKKTGVCSHLFAHIAHIAGVQEIDKSKVQNPQMVK